MTAHGRCLCGQVKVEVDDSKQPISIVTCRCANCLSTSSGPCSLVSIIDEADIKFSGPLKEYQDGNTESGVAITRSFCSNCGSTCSTVSPNLAGKVLLKYGLFAQGQAGKYPKPTAEIFCRNKNDWEKPVDGAATFDLALWRR